MENTLVDNDKEFETIYKNIQILINNCRENIYLTVNYEIIILYWNIGKTIMKIQNGTERAAYGKKTLKKLSEKLTIEFGKGFSIDNLEKMRKFYCMFENSATLSRILSWSHYSELIKIKENNKRNFYYYECINSRWSIRELRRQIKSALYERILNSNDKINELDLSTKGHVITTGKDLIKEPLILEFLDIKDNDKYSENELEKNILKHLKEFLLELGKGFAFIGNQERITIENENYYADLIFYNRLAKCFVIIDLKIGKVKHQDIGQMQMYVNYYDKVIKKSYENDTIGILLSTNKNKAVVNYTLSDDSKNINSIEYMLHFPSEQDLINTIEKDLNI